MLTLSGILIRLKALVFRSRADADLDEELRYHLEREIERNVANGMTARDARTAALRAFGNVTVATEQARDASRWQWLEALRQDVQFTIRTCRRTPTFALTIIGTIGLGLGLLTTAFTVFNAYVLRPLAVRDPQRLYEVLPYTKDQSSRPFTWQRFQALRARRDLLDDAFAYTFHPTRIRGSVAIGELVSGGYFDMLGVPPALGRTLTEADATPPAGNDVVVLSHRFWRATFGGDSSIVGRQIQLRDVPLTVVGVAREGFGGLGSVPIDFWTPITAMRKLGAERDPFGDRPAETVNVIGKLRPGTTVEQTSAALGAWLRAVTADAARDDRVASALLIARGTSIPATGEVYQLFAPIGAGFLFVLLIACANVANMMLARGLARQREIGVRLALGAGRGRLVRQLLTEAALLAIPAGLLGFLVSRIAIDVGIRVVFATVPSAYTDYLRVIPFDADARLVVFMLGSAALAAIAFGLAPALQATRPNIVQASRGDFDTDLRPSRLRNALVVAQITFSVLLLVSAGVLLGNARQMRQLDPGVRTRDVLQLDIPDRRRDATIERLHADARVSALASAKWAPLDGGWWVISLRNKTGRAEATNANFVSPEYFGVVDLGLISGRTFTKDEAAARAPVVVVSEAAARRFWPDGSAIGQTLTLTPTGIDSALFGAFRSATVIGVVRNAIPGVIVRPKTWPAVYYPQRLDTRDARLLARTRGDADATRTPIVAGIDSSAVDEAHSLASSFDLQIYPFRAAYWLATTIGIVAILLTITGVYGVLSYLVSQRRKEFGIRMALGAAGASVVGLVLRQSLRLTAIGVVSGLAIALVLSRVLAGSILLADAFDVVGYVTGVGGVVIACLVAAYVPSRKAASVSPVEALRADS